VPALLYKLKQKAMADCKVTARAYADCCRARVFSAIWACRADLRALNACLQQQCALTHTSSLQVACVLH